MDGLMEGVKKEADARRFFVSLESGGPAGKVCGMLVEVEAWMRDDGKLET